MKRRSTRYSACRPLVLLAASLLAACASQPPAPIAGDNTQTCPPPRACPACPVCPAPTVSPPVAPTEVPPPAAPLQRAQWGELNGWTNDDLTQAWPALRASCKGLAKQARWKPFCDAAQALGDRPAAPAIRRLIEDKLVPWAVHNPDNSTEGLITGYYEPLIKGSRTRSDRYPWPIHGVPPDLLTVDFGDLYPDLRNLRLRGRLVGNKVVPYWTRAEFDAMQDRTPAPVLLWAADPIELFFLQVQGSGRVELPDGTRVRVGYADQNGHPYQSIGRWLVAQGELPLEKASMEGIKNWAKTNPQRLPELLHSNPSYVFFKEMAATNDGPTGALGVPLTAGRSIAVDPRSIPLGAPVFLSSTFPLSDRPLRRLMFAQDTGGAIKGAVRADFFWGFGAEAGTQAGRMRQQGQLWVLQPRDDAAQ
ncbi:murein transglycosylase A [Azoarcus sp. KH32C]|uniref:murein transglycosylase A n=1 Tax=Azoarcus sp. KH32C TaxID=748247 RepID=UPI0002386230|nr:murein transglycosylase A [Azoarcus sp. KH32C]BAL23004.1 membrane-bound lytic murein transglycosylase A [Azoarcus sp. KH32C]